MVCGAVLVFALLELVVCGAAVRTSATNAAANITHFACFIALSLCRNRPVQPACRTFEQTQGYGECCGENGNFFLAAIFVEGRLLRITCPQRQLLHLKSSPEVA